MTIRRGVRVRAFLLVPLTEGDLLRSRAGMKMEMIGALKVGKIVKG